MTDARHGKRAVHNWANLPAEILRLVVANYLAYRPHLFLPSAWLHSDFHYQRNVFETIRDAYDLQRLMAVCPQWHRALVNLDFWVAACRKLDRQDLLGRSVITREAQAAALAGSAHANTNPRLVRNYTHFQFLSQACCLPCRINRPTKQDGIGNIKTTLATAPFGQVAVCKAHRNNAFCGVCLKDLSLASLGDHRELAKVPESLFENEDFETWPTVHTTCFHCRRDALLRTVALYHNPSLNLLEFIGGASLDTKDYEARSTLDSFVDMAEGGVNDVINVLLERHWLRANTNLGSLLDQAVASARYSRAEFEEYESEDEMLSDDDEESYDMLQSQEEGGVRTLAITAWARARIMDGNWVSPADIWCLSTGQTLPDSRWDPAHLPATLHPVPYSLQTSPNESTSMSSSEIDDPMSDEPTSNQQTMHYPAPDRHALLPSLRFAQLTSNVFRNTFRDILLDPMRHIVCHLIAEAQAARQDPCVRIAKVEMDDVLAMLRDERTWYVNSSNGSRLMNAIPYVPTSMHNMAPMTRTLLKEVWREACLPLFQCQCSICDRALRNQGQGQTGRVNAVQPTVVPSQTQAPPPTVVPSQEPQRQIMLIESEFITVEEVPADVEPPSPPAHPPAAPGSDAGSVRSRKRSSAELVDDPELVEVIVEGPIRTPRKRQRTGEKDAQGDDNTVMSSEPESPLEVDSGAATGPGSPANSAGVPSETSLSSSSASDSSSLRSVASGAPLSTLAAIRVAFKELESGNMSADKVKVHGRDEESMYDPEGDADEGVVYLH